MRIIYFLLSLTLLASCYRDKGNYQYTAINEVYIDSFNSGGYGGYYLVDTIRIKPEIHFTMDSTTPDRYSYEWSLLSGMFNGGSEFKISDKRDLDFHLTVPKNDYTLLYKIRDRQTDVVWTQASTLKVATYFDYGWLILGENNGHVTADMVSIPGTNDTVVIKDILQNNGLPPLKGPIKFFSVNRPSNNPLYMLTEDGAFELDKATFESGPHSNLSYNVYDLEKPANFYATDLLQNAGNARYMIGGEHLYVNSTVSLYNNYGNPSSKYKDVTTYFKVAPEIAWSGSTYGFVTSNLVAFNKDEKRFVKFTPAATFCENLPDGTGEPFMWKSDLELVRLSNSQFLGAGAGKGTMSYALMKSADNRYYVYVFSTGVATPQKISAHEVTHLPGISTMKNWAFAGNAFTMFYISGSKLYGYDLQRDQSFEKDFGHEVTMLHFDTFREKNDMFYVATYDNSKPANTGGEITKFTIVRNPNAIEISEIPGVKWNGLCRVKSMCWKWK